MLLMLKNTTQNTDLVSAFFFAELWNKDSMKTDLERPTYKKDKKKNAVEKLAQMEVSQKWEGKQLL